MRIQYFMHDISHSDTRRRVDMLREGGASVTVIGFHREEKIDFSVADKVIGLGQTYDGNFPQRIGSVLKALAKLSRYADELRTGDAFMARNLEMLVLGTIARNRFAQGKPLIYECLDIHRFMTSRSIFGHALRLLESRLLRQCQTLVTSSPGFVREYFERIHACVPRTIIVENKVFPAIAADRSDKMTVPPGPPWRIGWFGVIRCRRSLEILKEVAIRTSGLIEIVVAGRLAPTVFENTEEFSGIPGIKFVGPYKTEKEAAQLFSSVHFAWTLDFYEEGANSEWLLPNRLYRSAYYGSVPIGLATVETGRWLSQYEAGLRLKRADPETLIACLQQMSPALFATLQQNLSRIPTARLVTDTAECQALVRTLGTAAAA